jgi:O-antigen ligase
MLVFFLLQLISAAVSTNQPRAWSIIGTRSALLIFPATIGLISIRSLLKKHILLAYSVVIATVAFCCLIDAVHRSWVNHDAQWLYDDSLTKLIGRTSVYMALCVVLAIFSFGSLLENQVFTGRIKLAVYGCIAFLLVFHYLLASRISLLFLYATIIVYVFHRFPKGRKRGNYRWAAAGIAVLAIGSFFIFPKTLNRFRQLKYTHYDYHSRAVESHYNMAVTPDQWNGANFRLAVWNCGLGIARRHLLTGVPLGDKQAGLMAEYKSRDFMFAYTRHRNLHSTWLDVLVNTGIPGLLIFLLAYLVFPVVAAIRYKDWLSLAIVGCFAAAMLTETWIDGSFGSILLSFWLSLVSAWKTAPGMKPKRYPPLRIIHKV